MHQRLRDALKSAVRFGEGPQPSTQAMWYCHLFIVDRRKCLLFSPAETLFSFVVLGVVASIWQRSVISSGGTSRTS